MVTTTIVILETHNTTRITNARDTSGIHISITASLILTNDTSHIFRSRHIARIYALVNCCCGNMTCNRTDTTDIVTT